MTRFGTDAIDSLLAARASPETLLALGCFSLALVAVLIRGRASASAGEADDCPFDMEGGGPNGHKGLPRSVHAAASSGDMRTLRQWLAIKGVNADAATESGSTSLHEAARHGHANAVRLLLDHGADVLAVDAAQRTALHAVGAGGHGLCVKALLDAGADPESKDGNGATPLSLAEANRHVGTARMMRLHCDRGQASGDMRRVN